VRRRVLIWTEIGGHEKRKREEEREVMEILMLSKETEKRQSMVGHLIY
jgi:hypothetical protein